MQGVTIRLGSMLAIALLMVMSASAAWAVPLTFLIDKEELPAGVLTLADPGQLYLTINADANLFADVEKNTPISNGVITNVPNLAALLMDDIHLASGPFSLDGINGNIVVKAMLTPQGGFLSSALLAEVTLKGVNADQTTVALNAVPEPTSLLLLGPGLAGLAWLRRRYQGAPQA